MADHPAIDQPPSGCDELLHAIGEALRFKQTKEAIAKLVEKFAEDVPNRSGAMRRAFVIGHLMTVFVVLAIGAFGYFEIISMETAGALLGAVVGGPLFRGLQISRFDPLCLEMIRSDRATITVS